ncbi:MAG: pyrroline-5-carboxylate reductase [Alphaproteobacteria bacterium]|nr:MAG: pyrroline-5-carboxylate reductase [Alphaproteobacteria bacterium]
MADFSSLTARGLVVLGCGKMGGALLKGWLAGGLSPAAVWVIDPQPSAWLAGLTREGLHLNAPLPGAPAVCLIAVKPQMMDEALPQLAELGGGRTLMLSIAAGTPIRRLEAEFGTDTPVIRAMPNTPAAIGRGISALAGNAAAGEAEMRLAETLMRAVGRTVRLESEAQMDAVTAVSGSGPAYVFHLIECLAAAGAEQGLPEALAMELARAMVAGAGALADTAEETPEQLRINVTSPGGTTAAALAHLMDEETGLCQLMRRAVAAATARGRELAG